MQTDYRTNGAKLPPHIPYPRFLLTVDMKLITKVVYAVVLDTAMRSQAGDKQVGARQKVLCKSRQASIKRTDANQGIARVGHSPA